MAKRTSSLDACSVKVVDAQRVRATRRELTPQPEVERLTEVFRLLADPTRARILEALLIGEELCVCDLAASVGLPETTISQALRLLRAASVVRARRAGRMVFYSLPSSQVRSLLEHARESLAAAASASPERRSRRG